MRCIRKQKSEIRPLSSDNLTSDNLKSILTFPEIALYLYYPFKAESRKENVK